MCASPAGLWERHFLVRTADTLRAAASLSLRHISSGRFSDAATIAASNRGARLRGPVDRPLDQPNWKGSAGNDPPVALFRVVQWITSSAEI